MRHPARLALFVGLLVVSAAGPFIVMARVDAFALVLLRLCLAAPLLLGWSALRGRHTPGTAVFGADLDPRPR